MFKWNSNFGLMFSWVWAGGNHSCPVKRQWDHSYYLEISNKRISSIKSLKISVLITWGYLDVCWRGGDLKIGHIYHIYISEGNSILLFYFKYLIDLTKVYDYKCRSPPLQKKKNNKKPLTEKQNFTNTNKNSEEHLNSHHTTPGKNQSSTTSSIMPGLSVLTSFKATLCA